MRSLPDNEHRFQSEERTGGHVSGPQHHISGYLGRSIKDLREGDVTNMSAADRAKARVQDRADARKPSALRDDKLTLRPVKNATSKAAKVTKAARVYAEFEKGASLTEAAKATGITPAYVWDLAAAWQKRTGKLVPRNGHVAQVATEKAEVAK